MLGIQWMTVFSYLCNNRPTVWTLFSELTMPVCLLVVFSKLNNWSAWLFFLFCKIQEEAPPLACYWLRPWVRYSSLSIFKTAAVRHIVFLVRMSEPPTKSTCSLSLFKIWLESVILLTSFLAWKWDRGRGTFAKIVHDFDKGRWHSETNVLGYCTYAGFFTILQSFRWK